jgi:Zn-dependent peptidase ImmA (M78 family)/transcriptional regulator with XRE-family HTH domain
VFDGAVLKSAREQSGLSLEVAAALARVDPEELESVEAGRTPAWPGMLDTFAKAFGLSLTELLDGRAPETPSAFLFRSFGERAPSLRTLAESGALTTLGDFLRCVRAVSDLRSALGIESTGLEKLAEVARPTPPTEETLFPQTERLAIEARNALGLSTKPIESMRELFERIGIDIFYVTPEELSVDIDAASAITPGPAVLVNLVGGAEQWWRTRVTLAHELCHLLLDRTIFSASAFVMVSPATERATTSAPHVELPAPLELLEKRARAFAIHFLVPRQELIRVLAKHDPRSEAAVTTVCQHFQIGRQAAVNQLHNIGLISEHDRRRMLARMPANRLPEQHPDANIRRPGLRSGLLQDLVLQALGAGKISPLQARAYLELSPADPLPEAPNLDPALRAPLVTTTERIEKAVLRRLAADPELADCYVDALVPDGDTWRAEIAQAGAPGRAPTSRGFVVVGPDLRILEERLRPSSRA